MAKVLSMRCSFLNYPWTCPGSRRSLFARVVHTVVSIGLSGLCGRLHPHHTISFIRLAFEPFFARSCAGAPCFLLLPQFCPSLKYHGSQTLIVCPATWSCSACSSSWRLSAACLSQASSQACSSPGLLMHRLSMSPRQSSPHVNVPSPRPNPLCCHLIFP